MAIRPCDDVTVSTTGDDALTSWLRCTPPGAWMWWSWISEASSLNGESVMKNIRNRKRTCQASPLKYEWWDVKRFFFLFFIFLLASWWRVVYCETKTTPLSLFFFFFKSNSLSLHLWFLTSPLWPTSMSVDRDRHMQGGQQPCLASPSGPWQKISMGTDNGTSNENNTVCQPRNSACHSRPFPMLEVFHELWWTRELNLEFNSLVLHWLNTGYHPHMGSLVNTVFFGISEFYWALYQFIYEAAFFKQFF